MKLFFTIFGAILAAAAVLFGVYSYRQNAEKKRLEVAQFVAEVMKRPTEIHIITKTNPDATGYELCLAISETSMLTLTNFVTKGDIRGPQKVALDELIAEVTTILAEAKEFKADASMIRRVEERLATFTQAVASLKS